LEKFGGKIPGMEKELWEIHGASRNLFIDFEEVFKKVEISLSGKDIFYL